MPRRLRHFPDRAARALARQRLGPLRFQRVTPQTRIRYHRAASMFAHFVQQSGGQLAAEAADMDQQLCVFIEHLWLDGEGRNLAGDALSGIQFFLGRRRIFPMGWDLFRVWGRIEMPLRAPPMSVAMLCGMAHYCWSAQRPDAAVLMLVGYHCVLRTGELLGIMAEHVVIGPDGKGILALPWTKSGARRGAQEMVTIDDPLVGRALASLQARRGRGPLLAGTPAQFRQLFDLAAREVGLEGLQLKPYSLRRGGATHDMAAHGDLARAIHRGRWSDARTARIYINDGLALLAQQVLGPAVVRGLDARTALLARLLAAA